MAVNESLEKIVGENMGCYYRVKTRQWLKEILDPHTKEYSHLIDLTLEVGGTVKSMQALISQELKAQREDIRKKLPVKLTREIAALEFGWIDDEAVAYNSVIDQITKILEEQL